MTEPAEVVTALYRMLLLREPDDNGLAAWSKFIRDGGSCDDLLRGFLTSDEFRSRFPDFTCSYAPSLEKPFITEHSQHGETAKVMRLLAEQSATERLIVDVGARGRERSNSYDLMKHWGWRGLLIEANPLLLSSIREDFADVEFSLVHAAVSDADGTATLHIGVNDDVSAIVEENASHWGPMRGHLEVPMRRLGGILDEAAVSANFDILSLDIEGEDIKTLNDLIGNTCYRPRHVIIEASFNFQTKTLDDQPFSDAVKACYRIADQTVANLILQLK